MTNTDPIKDILRLFPYGLFVATSASPEGPRAATISWVTQVSFEPKLVAAAMRKGTSICEAVRVSRRFALHVVDAQQPELARAFFKANAAAPDEIGGYRYGVSAQGVPILSAASAWLECEVVDEAGEAGDHTLFIGRIVDAGMPAPGAQALSLRDTPWHYGG